MSHYRQPAASQSKSDAAASTAPRNLRVCIPNRSSTHSSLALVRAAADTRLPPETSQPLNQRVRDEHCSLVGHLALDCFRQLPRISGAVAAFISLRVDRRPPKPRLSWRASFIWNAGRRIASEFFRAARVITGALWGPCPSAGTSLAVRLTNCFLRNGDTLRRAFAITARSKELFRNAKSRAPAILMCSCASTRLAKLRPSSLSRSAAPRSAPSCLLMDTLRALQRYAAKTAFS